MGAVFDVSLGVGDFGLGFGGGGHFPTFPFELSVFYFQLIQPDF